MKKLFTRKTRAARNGTKKLLTQKSRTTRKKRKLALVGRVHPRLARSGGLTYVEIPALDVLQSAEFYTKVFGWQSRGSDPSQGRFTDPGGHLIGRWVVGRVPHDPGLLPFIYVDHIHTAVEAAMAHGGRIVKAPYLEGTLLVAVVRDPAGNMIALWQEETIKQSRRGSASA
jgi:predicted enzyme related to lactoylglutathione lyase